MNKHHYTTIETLALILNSKKIRFNRLTNVDDIQESKNYGKYDLSRFIYISCWTLNDEESIPLWKMYTSDMKGVRITFNDDPFHIRRPNPSEMPGLNISVTGDTLTPIPLNQMMSDQYFIMPSFLTKEHFGKAVEYVDDVTGIYENAVDLKVNPDGTANMSIPSAGDLAIHKNKVWAFQEEFRYNLLAFPPPLGGFSTQNIPEISNTAINAIYRGIAPETEFIDVDICPEKLSCLTITLGPLCSFADELLVKALLEKYSPNSRLVKSKLSGQIRRRT
ncbi:MAG: DUF2971 domain-containing protein [Alteromonas macleodii]|jgi:hypothetical protein